MKLFITVLGLVFVLEAIPYVLFPEAMQRWLAQISLLPPAALRMAGLFALGLGVLLCYLTQRTDLIP
ncbi:MAG: DUF2065 domain-containing protein [Desulfobulbaceae bacterium]|nr:DUF2065 domain-containing protein [Desulfobulbaceae bacterium]HIJ79185.1 DUF2065 domain-containing protein [Deltaproteobacteria bacterium]